MDKSDQRSLIPTQQKKPQHGGGFAGGVGFKGFAEDLEGSNAPVWEHFSRTLRVVFDPMKTAERHRCVPTSERGNDQMPCATLQRKTANADCSKLRSLIC